MNRIRIGCAITVILAGMYSAAGLLVSLQQFGVGLAIAAAATIAYGYVDFSESRDMQARERHRAEVWHRREADDRNQWHVENIYSQPRDGVER